MSIALHVSHLYKKFGTFTAVDGISFSVQEGEIVGLLGPNGAGKTTTMQMLLGLITSDSGTIHYFGKDFFQNKEESLSRINFASAYSFMNSRMTVYENLRIYAGLYGVSDPQKIISQNIDLLEIKECMHKKFWKLSSGQKTRVILAKALLNRPKLLLLDEPTASLDPDISEHIHGIIKRLQKIHSVAMLYTSHNMSEIEQICDRVLFLDKGKIFMEDTPLGLTRKIGSASLVLTIGNKTNDIQNIIKAQYPSAQFDRNEVVVIPVVEDAIAQTIIHIKKLGFEITDIDIKKPSLEDVFLSIAKGTLTHPILKQKNI